MNGYELQANAFRKYLDKHPELDKDGKENVTVHIKALDYMADATEADMYALFDTGAFNEVVLGYVLQAMDNSKVPEKHITETLSELKCIFDSMTAYEAVTRYQTI